jgi:hypothetical protein
LVKTSDGRLYFFAAACRSYADMSIHALRPFGKASSTISGSKKEQ